MLYTVGSSAATGVSIPSSPQWPTKRFMCVSYGTLRWQKKRRLNKYCTILLILPVFLTNPAKLIAFLPRNVSIHSFMRIAMGHCGKGAGVYSQ